MDSSIWVEHTLSVERELADLSSSTGDVETTYLEYVVTDEPEPLRRLEAARVVAAGHLQRIEDLTADNASQQRSVAELRRSLDEDAAQRAVVLTKRREAGWEAARRLVTAGTTARRDAVRSRIGEMVSGEERLLRDRSRRASADAGRATFLGATLGLFAFFSLGIGYVLIRKEFRGVLAALQRSEESVSTTLDSIGDAVIATDAAGRIVRMNPVAEQLTGWPVEDAEGRDLAEVFHIVDEETHHPVESPVAKVLRGGKVVGLGQHTLLLSRNGTERAVSDSSAPIRSAAGEPVGVVLVFRDRTDERKAERALEASEARFRRLRDSGIIGIAISDMQGNVTEANDAFLAMAGYSREDLAAGRLSGTTLNTPEGERTDASARRRLHVEGVVRPWEKELVRKDGSLVPVLIAVTVLDETSFVSVVADLTEKKRGEMALQKTQARLAALSDAGIIGIVVATLDERAVSRIVEINDALLDTVGYGRAEILSGAVAWGSLTPPEWRDADAHAIADLSSTGITGLREKEYLHKNGARVPVIVGSTRTSDETISFVLDVTANKQAAVAIEHLREVRASEMMFRGLLEASPDAMVIVDSAGEIVLVNQQTERLFGYARDELIGQSIDVLGPERFREDRRALRSRYVAKPATSMLSSSFEQRGIRKDGTEFPAEIRLGSMESDGGVLVCSAIRDISERRMADEQRFRLAAIVESSADAIIGKTLDGVITSWNDGARRIFGYTAEEIVGKSVYTLIPAGREDEEVEILRRLRNDERFEQFDTVRRRKDGREIDVSLTSSPVHDSTGALIGASKIVRNITERKVAEQALARAKDEAEAANRELEAFSYSVAHDLRGPLRGMNGFAQVLVDSYRDKLDAEGQDWLQEILLNAKKMGELIDALLSLARVTRSELRRDDVDLSAVVREVAAQLAALEPERSVELVVEDHLHAEADIRLVRALFQNLLGNAWKFTGKVAAARIEFGETEKGSRAFFIRDNGAGFDMAYANKLFAPFQRLHTVDEYVGTGIGLATVQRIAHRHGGRVWAEGAVDRGATFYFTFSREPGGAQ